MTRFPDWHSRLEHFLFAQSGIEFCYGRADCCLWVCSAVACMTGTDLASSFRNRYSTRRQARALLTAAGGFTAIANSYNLPEIAVNHAKRGDIIQLTSSILGLRPLSGKGVLVLCEHGIALTSSDKALRAFSI
jgi:hypothetical protein